MAPPPPPELMDEILEEVLLRLPPDDPSLLLNAALVCKRWCRLVAHRSFHRRYRELHRTLPVLGFIHSVEGINGPCAAYFDSRSSFHPPRAALSGWWVLNSGHGRVLLNKEGYLEKIRLLVWDPMTDKQQELPTLSWYPLPSTASWNAAVLCASAGSDCNHLDCRRGPFLVLFVGTHSDDVVARVYSSEAGAWHGVSQSLRRNPIMDCIRGSKSRPL